MPDAERALTPVPVDTNKFNERVELPFGLTTQHIKRSMEDFIDFLGFINTQLNTRSIPRLECFIMAANFSSIVGEFLNMTIPKYCNSLTKNKYPNGHPDLLPSNRYPNDSQLHAQEGIEIKGSRHSSGWQGHNPERVWLMVFCFDNNTASDYNSQNFTPKPFKFTGVYAAQLEESDWGFSGRSATSRRTITASVINTGVEKMKRNWVYKDQA